MNRRQIEAIARSEPRRRALFLLRHGIGALAGALVIALFPATSLSATEAEGVGESALDEAFPALFAPAVDDGTGDYPLLSNPQADGSIVVNDFGAPGGATLHVDSTNGTVLSTPDGGDYGITSIGDATAGLAADRVLVFDRPAGDDYAVRPTSEGGVEIVEQLPVGDISASYRLDTPDGTELRLLDNGDVAVVRPGASPVGDVAAAAAELTAAEDELITAALDDISASEQETEAFEEVTTLAEDAVEPGVVEALETEDVPVTEELPDWTAEDATASEVDAGIDRLASDLTPSDFTEAELADLEALEAEATAMGELTDATEVAGDVAEDSAALAEANLMLDEDLAEATVTEAVEEVTAGLDIGDSDAEGARSAAAAVEAQAEVGPQDRVEAVFSAPLSETVSGVPVVTTLQLEGDVVEVVVPEGVDETIVVDPIWFLVAAVVVRVAPAIIRAAPHVVRAAKAFAKTNAARTAARVAAQMANAAKQHAIRAAQAAAARVAQAAAAARARAAIIAKAIARKVAQTQAFQRAKQIAAVMAKRARAMRQKAVEAARALARNAAAKAKTAGGAAKAKLPKLVTRTIRATSSAVKTASSTTVRLGRTVPTAVEKASRAVVSKIAKHARSHPVAWSKVTKEVSQTVAENEAVEYLTDRLNIESDCYEAAMFAHQGGMASRAVGGLYQGIDFASCVIEAVKGDTQSHEADPGRLVPARAPSSLTISAYIAATAAEQSRALTFANSATAPLAAGVTSRSIPGSFPTLETRYLTMTAKNTGRPVKVADSSLYVSSGIPYAVSGTSDSGRRLTLTDENADGTWSTGELATATVGVRPPAMKGKTIPLTYRPITGTTQFGASGTFNLVISGVERYKNTIVGQSGTATTWYVSPDLMRMRIPDSAATTALKSRGVKGTYVLDSSSLSLLPVAKGDVATGPTWKNNQSLRIGMEVKNSKGYRLIMQSDGNLVLKGSTGRVLWSTDRVTAGWYRQKYVIFQSDGNLVTYDSAGKAVWSPNIHDRGGNKFIMQTDGNVVVYAGTKVLWATRTNGLS